MNYTDEQKQDFEERATAFQKEHAEFYKTLKEKYECQFIQAVQTVPSPSGVFGLTVVESVGDTKFNKKEEGVPSPFIPGNESLSED